MYYNLILMHILLTHYSTTHSNVSSITIIDDLTGHIKRKAIYDHESRGIKKFGLKARCSDASHRHFFLFTLFPRGRNCDRAYIVTFAVVSKRRGWSTGRTVEGSNFSRNWRARVCPSGMGQTWFRNSQWTHFNPVPARLDEKDSSREKEELFDILLNRDEIATFAHFARSTLLSVSVSQVFSSASRLAMGDSTRAVISNLKIHKRGSVIYVYGI